jgi:tellurite resistance-related uncharacterized protein
MAPSKPANNETWCTSSYKAVWSRINVIEGQPNHADLEREFKMISNHKLLKDNNAITARPRPWPHPWPCDDTIIMLLLRTRIRILSNVLPYNI